MALSRQRRREAQPAVMKRRDRACFSAMALRLQAARRVREPARGDVTVRVRAAPAAAALRPAVTRRLIVAPHARVTAPRAPRLSCGGGLEGARIRELGLGGALVGLELRASDANETRRPGRAGALGKEIDGGIGPAREKRRPTLGTRETGTCAAARTPPAPPPASSRRAGLPTARPSARPASSRRAGHTARAATSQQSCAATEPAGCAQSLPQPTSK